MNKVELTNRTRQFTISAFKLVEKFPKSKAADVIAYQQLKSASSVGANYRAANRAKSKPDFINKLKIVLEEADESNFWFSIIKEIELVNGYNKELEFLINESNELTAIFASAVKTLTAK